MKLESILIKRYRSAREVHLPTVGDFNVFIGKNNSGKSTLLRAIRAFYSCLRRGEVIALDAPIGRDAIDFSNRKTGEPIEITITFSMELAERDSLIRDIAIEAPQLKNAVDGLDPSLRLEISLTVMPPPARFAYTRRLSLVPAIKATTSGTPGRILFQINHTGAKELADKVREARKYATIAEDINKVARNMDEDDFQGMRRGPEESIQQARFTYLTRRILGDTLQESGPTIETLVRQSNSFADFQSGAKSLAAKFLDQSATTQAAPLKSPVETFSGEQSSVPQYVLNLIKTIGAMPVLYLTETRKQVGKEEAERLLQLKVERGGDQVLGSIKQKVAALLGVKIDAFAGGTGQPSSRNAEMDIDNFLLEVNGSGIREALRLILDVEFQNPKVLLVEEPEVHLHPALETNLMGYLKKLSRECQVFISTHSTNFLDAPDMESVFLVSKSDGCTQVQTLGFEEAEAKLPKELGIRLSSLFMFDRLVFVEGPTDEAIIREWASTLSVNLSQGNIGFISMGGARNFGYYAADTIMNFLSRRQVKVWFILDRDERDAAEIQRLREKLGDKARAEILDRREIENFMIVPSALTSFIEMKQNLSGKKTSPQVTPELVITAIDECANDLKQLAVQKQIVKALCVPIYPQKIEYEPSGAPLNERIEAEMTRIKAAVENTIKGISAEIDKQSQEVETDWDHQKLKIVPGDALIDKVCQRFGTRFRKASDGSRLASFMRASEIDPQIARIILDLGTL